MKHTKKSMLSVIITLLLAIVCTVMALAADGTAFAMKLARIEGTVDIFSGSSRKVSVRKDMRLYNSYEMSTLDRSYAWVSLDNRRMVKLDAASEASVRKKGRKLEILLDSGNLFFNVAKPLEDDESYRQECILWMQQADRCHLYRHRGAVGRIKEQSPELF